MIPPPLHCFMRTGSSALSSQLHALMNVVSMTGSRVPSCSRLRGHGVGTCGAGMAPASAVHVPTPPAGP